MKKILVLVVAALFSFQFVSAQDVVVKYQLRTPGDKTKLAMEKVKSFNLSKDDNEKTDKVIGEFYKDEQKMLDAAIKNGIPDINAYKAKKVKLAEDRDDKLKKIFSKEQYKSWVEVILPSLKPQRPS
jgi:hypothetical protein